MSFWSARISCFGNTVSATGIRPPADRVQTILDYPVPKTAESLRRFIGVFNFYRRFVKNASELEAPLHEALSKPILKGSQPIVWTPALEENFKRCRESIASAT